MALNDNGNHLGFELQLPVTYVVTAVLSIALYNVIELSFILFLTFKRRNGLYFWSFLVATWGVAAYAIGFILKDFNLANSISYFYVTLIILGWCAMVTGQSMVLYSRLHLVVRRQSTLRFVLGMIIFNAIVLHIPTIILCYGANSAQYYRFTLPYAVYERVEVTIFFVQESIISGLYVYETCKLLRFRDNLDEVHGRSARRLMLHLIYMNVIVTLLDISILTLEYAGRYASQTAVKALVYSVKLKLEFNILNRLVKMVRRDSGSLSGLDYGSGSQQSRHSRRSRHGNEEEGDGAVHRHHQRRCSWVVFASRVKHAIAGSTAKDVTRSEQVVNREPVTVDNAQSRISVMIAAEVVVRNAGSQLAGDSVKRCTG